jgi:hypothetical protein
MSKIPTSLQQQCLANLQKPFNVIVTGTLASDEATQLGLASLTGLDNIYSGSLLGETILTMAQQKTIDSIELDGEMGILQG